MPTEPTGPLADITVPPGNQVTVKANDGVVRVLVMKNDGSGMVGYKDLPAGAKVQDAVGDTRNAEIRVNGQPAAPTAPLKDGDKVSVTPKNIEGAHGRRFWF
jgi:hypothetical protein